MLRASAESTSSRKYAFHRRREPGKDCAEHGEPSIDMHTAALEKAGL
jgi:hypothetical protein